MTAGAHRRLLTPPTVTSIPGLLVVHGYSWERAFPRTGWAGVSVVATFSVPASDFVLGRALRDAPADLSVELDEVVPTGTATVPYVWVVGEPCETFEAVLADAPELDGFEVDDNLDDGTLYRVDWRHDADSVVKVLVDHDAVLLEAGGNAESWQFDIRFPDADVLSDFHDACREVGIALDVDRLYNRVEGPDGTVTDMTEAQHSLLERAFDAGYFDVPRQTTLKELSDRLGISDQAANERMRRGLHAVLAATVKSGRSPADE